VSKNNKSGSQRESEPEQYWMPISAPANDIERALRGAFGKYIEALPGYSFTLRGFELRHSSEQATCLLILSSETDTRSFLQILVNNDSAHVFNYAFVARLHTFFGERLSPKKTNEPTAPPLETKRRRGQKQEAVARRRKAVEDWKKQERYITQQTFCEKEGISTATLRRWIGEYERGELSES
jgi:hypothetical protein